MNFAIVGAGFSGAVMAQELAKNGHRITVFESRDHIGGNCYTVRDQETGILIHKYGPHIFHTNDAKVWKYINSFTEFMPYVNRVKTTSLGQVYSLPINLHTINQFFRTTMNPTEAEQLVCAKAMKIPHEPETFEEQALKFVGSEIYEAFLKGYTIKQWGISPKDLPASILKRLPLRFNYDDNYFNHIYQGMPKYGYTPIFEKLLHHQNIKIYKNKTFDMNDMEGFDHVFYTGAIDAFFGFKLGSLGYRTLDFVQEQHSGDFQGCAVMNYADQDVPFTRISEHKHFAPWENHTKTVIFKEYSRKCDKDDIPYYPIRLVREKQMLKNYVEMAKQQKGVSFLGRLGTYRYLDMDVTIMEALNASEIVKSRISEHNKIPNFFVEPI